MAPSPSIPSDLNGHFSKMSESPAGSPPQTTHHVTSRTATTSCVPEIPIEIVTEEEMAFFEAALAAATRCSLSSSSSSSAISSPSRSSLFQNNARSIRTITALSKRRLSEPEIEDLGDLRSTQKKNKLTESLFHRFRKKRGLSVTDLTSTEWCEKQMEFVLLYATRKTNEAMKAGIARHTKLEEKVVKKVGVRIQSVEDVWALKFMNFITGVNQLLLEGLTRELPLIGFVEGVWMVGKVDEIRMPEGETSANPIFVDTKTRVRDTLPAEPQRRNGRLQLMCYKYLWDSSVADNFPFKEFLDFYSLDPYHVLSKEIREHSAKAGILAKTFDDIVRCYKNASSMLLPANKKLLLRYELQKDNSLLAEDEFEYDHDWLKSQIQSRLEFWMSEREASYTTPEERWKCLFCRFSSICPASTDTTSDASNSAKRTNTAES